MKGKRLFESESEKRDHEALIKVIDDLPYAEPSCWSYPEAFFESDDKPDDVQKRGFSHDESIAIKLCNGCEAKVACAAYALKWNVQGIWGGTTTSSRKRLRAELKKQAARNSEAA